MRENEEREHPASDQVRGERWSTASFEVKGNTLEDGGGEVESEGKVNCECFRRQVVFSSQQLRVSACYLEISILIFLSAWLLSPDSLELWPFVSWVCGSDGLRVSRRAIGQLRTTFNARQPYHNLHSRRGNSPKHYQQQTVPQQQPQVAKRDVYRQTRRIQVQSSFGSR